jgi:hypothetical protein
MAASRITKEKISLNPPFIETFTFSRDWEKISPERVQPPCKKIKN